MRQLLKDTWYSTHKFVKISGILALLIESFNFIFGLSNLKDFLVILGGVIFGSGVLIMINFVAKRNMTEEEYEEFLNLYK